MKKFSFDIGLAALTFIRRSARRRLFIFFLICTLQHQNVAGFSFSNHQAPRRVKHSGSNQPMLFENQCSSRSSIFKNIAFHPTRFLHSAQNSVTTDALSDSNKYEIKDSKEVKQSVTFSTNQDATAKQSNDSLNGWPWSNRQTAILKQQLPRYTITIQPVETTNYYNNDGWQQINGDSARCFILWKSLSNEVPELSGYPLEILILAAKKYLHNNNDNKEDASVSPILFAFNMQLDTILPFLDEFYFASSGGISGRVWGVPGIADGTRIATPPLSQVATTLPKGFVITQDGSSVYELGRPLSEDGLLSQQQEKYSLDYGKHILSSTATQLQQKAALTKSSESLQSSLVDPDLFQLGVLTAIVVSGAVAFETLSHHLTINVFWV